MHINEFAEKHLFNPLDIYEHDWWMSPGGLPQAHTGLILKPRDMAKLGQLFLNKGLWKDKQIISEKWIQESIKDHVQEPRHYGYQWWRQTFEANGEYHEAFYAAGNGGQFMFCFPDLDIVVVFTAGNYGQNFYKKQVVKMLSEVILPAIDR